MRRLILALALLLPLSASADWSITATWTRSTGATLDHEQVYYDGAPRTECLIPAGAPTTCQFVLTDAQMGKALFVRSSNSMGAYNDTVPVTVIDVPPASTGVSLVVQRVP